MAAIVVLAATFTLRAAQQRNRSPDPLPALLAEVCALNSRLDELERLLAPIPR
jgi:hypothetical protein